LQGAERDPLVVGALWELAVNPTFDWGPTMQAYQAILNKPRAASAAAEQMRLERKMAFDQAAVVRRATDGYEPAVEYPDAACDDPAKPCNWFAHQLLDCAKLIVAGLGVRVLALSSFGYDTHAGQNDGEFHDYLLAGIGDAIGAFVRDLRAHGVADRVVILVFTEFGRRPEENADGGTDHGFGGGMFVIGDAVRGGVYGDFPSLEPGRLVLDGNLDVTVDFRTVYATILERHLGADSQQILGGSFPALELL
jgi:uncharacterized protein (DUF1501 family)